MTRPGHLAEPSSVSSSQIKPPRLVLISTITKYKMEDHSTWLTMKYLRSATGKSTKQKIKLISTTREGCTPRACHLIWVFSRSLTSFSWFNRFSLLFRIKFLAKWTTIIIMVVDRDAITSIMEVDSNSSTRMVAVRDIPLPIKPQWALLIQTMVTIIKPLLCMIHFKINSQ